MKKIILLLSILYLTSFDLLSNDHIEISLLTCSSGKETFTAWGHSAIRVQDKKAKIDVVYNFGLFDFDTPNFYMKFIKGKLKYKLGVHHTQRFYNSYLLENRQIIEQELELTNEDKEEIINRLEYLYRPENRYYYYSFVKKNCTTELRDLLLENVETDFENEITTKTYRQQLNEYLKNRLWLKFSMSLIMGYKVDKKIDKFESLFLPYYLYNGIKDLTSNGKKLLKNENIYNTLKDDDSYPILLSPLFILSMLLIAVLITMDKTLQNTILLVIGLTGLVIFSVSLITEHIELRYNLNPLWINPLYIVLVFLNRKSALKRKLAILLQVLLLVMVPIWVFKIQYIEWSYLPVILILTIINLRIIFPKTRLFLKFG